MVKKLVSKSEFARMAGVRPSAVTKACSNALKDSMDGKRIDAAHPEAVKYLDGHNQAPPPPPPATGIDPLYEQIVAFCRVKGKFTITPVQLKFKIPFNRAKKIIQTIKAAGVVLDGSEPTPPAVEPESDKSFLRGHAAKNAKAKQAPPPPPIDVEEMLHEIPEDIRAFADMSLRELVSRFGTDTRFCDWLRATKSIEDINEKRLKNAVSRGELVSRDLMKIGVIEPIDAAHRKMLTDGAKTIARRLTAMHDAGRSLEDCEEFVVDQISSFIRPVKSKVARALRNA